MAENKPKDQSPVEHVGAPVAGPDRVATPRPSETLNAFEMEGKGQTLPDSERKRVEQQAALTEQRRKHAEEAKAAEIELLLMQRESVGAEQAERAKVATADADAQRETFIKQRERMLPLSVDPATLALEAALSAQLAAALEQDETVPGGAYIVGNEIHDADGRVVGRVNRD